MAGKVKLPGIGEVPKGAAIAGGAVVLGIVGYAYYKHRQNSAAAAAAASTTATDTSQAGIDPATGYPYGSPQDQAALAAEQGYYGAGGGYGGGYYPYGGGGGPGTPSPGTTVGVPQVTGSSQATAIAAIQAAGLVPFPSSTEPGGNVSSQSPAAGTQVAAGSTVYWQAGSGGGGGNVTVPNVVGQEVDAAQRALAAAGLTWSRPQLKPGVGYHVTAQNPAAGAQVASGTQVALSITPNK